MTTLLDPEGTGETEAPPAVSRRPVAEVPDTLTKARWEQVALAVFIVVPLAATIAAIPLLWNRWVNATDIVLLLVFYAITGHGITVGFHRYFTHSAFKARRPVRIALAVAGSMAIEGPVIRWVADHRRHHAFSDKEGDPHSPWRYGTSLRALAKGLFFAHMGWLFDVEQTSQNRFAPDLLADPDIRRVHHAFRWLVAISLLAPALIGGLISMSWMGALQAFFWASLVRVCLLHHVTWSINSICHAVGERPFTTRDKSGNVWWLALPSMGESWHNLHHAEPTSARHGVDRFQFDTSARLIWFMERLHWVHDVRWPRADRLLAKRSAPVS
jgi:stearoyl-CoA desaturase (delta-9 desaturase)